MTNFKLDKLCIDFDGHFSLKDIDWSVEDNQHWVIVGPNGSGKSALAGALIGDGNVLSGSVDGLP